MTKYCDFTKAQLESELAALQSRYGEFCAKNLKLDMSRGKPCTQQLDLSLALNDCHNYVSDGFDVRNYGLLDGIPACKKLFAELLGVGEQNIIIGPNSSLTLMFDYISQCFTHGAGSTPWCKLPKVKFLCPVPGYDRHFTILEYFGIEMINVPMTQSGPDMAAVEEYVKDSAVQGMFCVPKYSNPQGITYSDSVVRKIAALKPAAADFRVIWDNAYIVHDLADEPDALLNIFDVLPEYGNEDMVVEVCSTSKITFPGAGVSAIAASANNIAMIKKRLGAQTISYDKMNQQRHAEFFKNAAAVKQHMKKHAAIIKPKFDIVATRLEKELGTLGIAEWSVPNGGYFISLDVMPGTAGQVGRLCKEAGVVLTSVGATFPYGKDPDDKNIRIAPTYPPEAELAAAAEILCIAVRIAACEKLLENAK
ncbi:MAG: aminotransferase class I/II-fold pyridoxal phosphate-dependent enzyme [Clostridiales bacterium]|nr:aminotransferase class I/II-fold pyridoxal phosphate-dependent enzyme [Clostridiales bacterium]